MDSSGNQTNATQPPAPQTATAPPTVAPAMYDRRAALARIRKQREEELRVRQEERARERKLRQEKQRAAKEAREQARREQEMKLEAIKAAKRKEQERIREEKMRLIREEAERIEERKRKQREERKAFEEKKKAEIAKKRAEHVKRMKAFENRKLSRQEEEKERKRRQELARKKRLEYERACRMYPIEDSLLYKEPEPPGFPLPKRPNKLFTLPIPNDVISPAMRVHGFCSMLSETLKLETCTFEEFYMALSKSRMLYTWRHRYTLLCLRYFENEYDEMKKVAKKKSDEEDAMPVLPMKQQVNDETDVVARWYR